MRAKTAAVGLSVLTTFVAPAWSQEDGLSLSAAYRVQRDDNLFRIADGVDPRLALGRDSSAETVHIRSLGLRFAHDYGLQRIEADVGLTDYAYDHYHQLDLLARNHNLRWHWAVTPSLTGTLRSQKDQSVNSFDDASVLNAGNRRTRRADGLDAKWQIDGAWSVVGDVQEVRNRNEQPQVGEDSSRQTSTAIGLRRETPKGSSATLRWRSGSGETLDTTHTSAPLRDSNFSQDAWLLDLRWVVSARTRLDLNLAWVDRQHSTLSVRDYDALNTQLSLNWTPTARTLLRATWSDDTNSYQTDNASVARTRRLSWLAQWAASAKLALIAQGGTAERRYLQPPPGQVADTRRDRTNDLSLTLRWSATRDSSFDIGWQRNWRQSSTASARFHSESWSAGLSTRF